MASPVTSVCPYLGLADDRTVERAVPDPEHRCYALIPPWPPDDQSAFCLSAGYRACPFYREPEPAPQVDATRAYRPPAEAATAAPAADTEGTGATFRPEAGGTGAYPPETGGTEAYPPETGGTGAYPPWLRAGLIAVAVILLAAVAFTYGRDLLRPPAAGQPPVAATRGTEDTAAPAGDAATQEATATPLPATPGAQSAIKNPQSTIRNSPTPVPGGRVITVSPRAGDAGWWSSDKTRGNLGDSYLYAGHYGDQAFVSAVRLDLRAVPRGAPIEDGKLYLTGLLDDRFDPAAGGNWLAQLLPGEALPDLARADFQALFNAPAAVTLLPTLYPADLAANQVNTLSLDRAGRDWLEREVAEGRTEVILRITGPAGGVDTLFAWDSGAGPATAGEPPRFVLSVGAPPPTPPPLPTEAVIVATLTPTPANVLTAAADALTATALAEAVGTATPLPYRIVTPTPVPANLATAQALGAAEQFVPIVIYTPTPANSATATAYAVYATAVAVTTGTFTPVPENAVTPVIVLPTPFPENVATAAAQMLTATAQARTTGTVTPVPTGALIATLTPTRPLIWPTATPANFATAAAHIAYATAVALTTGTFTPIPRNAVTPTSEPPPTPLPLLVPITPKPAPTPTPTPPGGLPQGLAGTILFFSDRDGGERLYALNPNTGRLLWVTQEWPYAVALSRETRSPDGRYDLVVQADRDGNPQVFLRDNRANSVQQVVTDARRSYDPVWSPTANRIAYVAVPADNRNDEIYTADPDGSNVRRLTTNTWEWDKHPSWSPDGRQIVFWSNRETGRRQLWIMNADGSNQRRLLVSAFNDWDPIWVK